MAISRHDSALPATPPAPLNVPSLDLRNSHALSAMVLSIAAGSLPKSPNCSLPGNSPILPIAASHRRLAMPAMENPLPPLPPDTNSPRKSFRVQCRVNRLLSEPRAPPPICTPWSPADSMLTPSMVPAMWELGPPPPRMTPIVTRPFRPFSKPKFSNTDSVLKMRPPRKEPPFRNWTMPDQIPEQSHDGLPTPPYW